MSKQELIKLIYNLPDNINIINYTSEEDIKLKIMDIRIFLEPKSEEFYNWYFGF